jgi:putative peptidoglycan lipid II flippase
VLNSLTEFVAAAFAPALLNIALIAAQLIVPEGGVATARALAFGVIAGGVLQLALCWIACGARGSRSG